VPDSVTGAGTQSDSDGRAVRLEALVQKYLEAAIERERLKSLDPPQNPHPDGERSRKDSSLRRGGVPQMYAGARWSHVRSPAVQNWSLTIKERTYRRSQEGTRQPKFVGRGVLILGPVGTGKSSAAALLCRATVEAGRSVVWQYVPDLVDQLMDKAMKRQEIIARASNVDLLVWDDFGVRDMADWELGYLDQIVERRYREFRPMVVTSNLSSQDLVGDSRLDRIVDRWRQRTASERIILSGASMRGEFDGD